MCTNSPTEAQAGSSDAGDKDGDCTGAPERPLTKSCRRNREVNGGRYLEVSPENRKG